jgi:type II secretory pathway pseudopilin PulG
MRAQSGVTLLEMVIVLIGLAVVAAFIYPVLSQAVNAYDASSAAVHAATKGRYALERAAREARGVRRSTADDANYDITTMLSATFAFTRNDGVTVTLTCSGSTLTVQYSSPAVTSTLSDQLTTCQFDYYQQDGATTATGPGNVQFVQLALALTQGAASYSNRVRVALRSPQ